MKKTILSTLVIFCSLAVQAGDTYGEFRARVINDPVNPTGSNLVIGSQINVVFDINTDYYPNNYGHYLDSLPTSRYHYLYFIVDFILVDKNGIYPDVFLDKQNFDIFGINLQNDEPVEYTARHWYGDNPIKHSITINSCHYLQSTTYQLAVRVNYVAQSNENNDNSSLYSHFTMEAVHSTTGAYQACQITQGDFQFADGGFIDNINCVLEDVLEFDFLDPTAIPPLIMSTDSILWCTTMQYQVHIQAGGGLPPYTYKNGPIPCGEDLVLTPGSHTLWVVDANGCSVFEKMILDNYNTLFPDSEFDYPNGKYITNASQTLTDVNGDGVIRIKGPLIIEEGINYSLTNKNIQFGRDIGDFNWKLAELPISGIIIESFAKLTVSGCKFTGIDLCTSMWDGIQVRGDAHPPLQLNESGTVWFPGELVLTNSEIHDAFTGVALYNMNYQRPLPLPIPNAGGQLHWGNGKITATGSHFVNNRTGIAFKADFENLSESKITSCSFVCNALLKDQVLYPNEGTDKFISIIGISDVSKRIEIKANTFEGNPAFAEDKRGTGIYSNNSSYLVSSGKIGTLLIPNGFVNLTKGIDVYSTGSLSHVVRIKDNHFEKVMQGITSNGSHFDEISFNEFFIPAGIATVNSWGLNLYNSSGYLATENNFNTLANSIYTYGVLARNNSLANGGVYRNTFSGDFYAATQAEQTNTKLELKCNTYTGNNLYDWAVTSGSLTNQGACVGTDDKTPAGNLFSICSVIDESQIFKAVAVPTFTYNSHAGIEPTCVSSNINIQTCSGPTYDVNTSCPTLVDPPAGIGKGSGGKTGKNEFKLDRVREIRRLQEEGNISGIVQLLTNGTLPEDVYLLIPTLLERGDCETARLKLASVALNTTEGQAYFKLYNVLTTLCEGNRNIEQLTISEQQEMQEVSESDTRVSVHAQAVLAQLNEKAYLRVAERFNNNKTLIPNTQQNMMAKEENSFTVFPNPSEGELTVLMYKNKKGTILISDALGRKYFEKSVVDSGEQKWITNLSKGVYVIQFTDEAGITESKRIFVQN